MNLFCWFHFPYWYPLQLTHPFPSTTVSITVKKKLYFILVIIYGRSKYKHYWQLKNWHQLLLFLQRSSFEKDIMQKMLQPSCSWRVSHCPVPKQVFLLIIIFNSFIGYWLPWNNREFLWSNYSSALVGAPDFARVSKYLKKKKYSHLSSLSINLFKKMLTISSWFRIAASMSPGKLILFLSKFTKTNLS